MLDITESITEAVNRWTDSLGAHRVEADCSDGSLLALIESCERLKDACSAVQARATHEYSERRLAGLTPGSTADRVARRDVGARIGRARHVSPFHGGRYLELSRMLVRDLPRTLDALAAGHTTEHRASLIAHAAGCLGSADRATLDADLGPRLTGKGNRAVQGEADRIAAELDAEAVVERHRRAVAERRVTSRPAPDTMTYLTALLPVADGVAAWAALDRHTTLAKAAGDCRTRGQIMADELTHRLLHGAATHLPGTGGQTTGIPASGVRTAGPTGGPAVPPTLPSGGYRLPAPETDTSLPIGGSERATTIGDVADRPVDPAGVSGLEPTHTDPPGPSTVPAVRQIDLMLVMTDRALLDGADTPAIMPGHGPIPASLARGLLADADPGTRVFLRRLYTDPTGTQLLSADARGRLFPAAIRQFVLARDQRCRTPWCDAPIRHIDHTVPHSTGGATSPGNSTGLCARCNLAKTARTDAGVVAGPAPPPPRSSPWNAVARGLSTAAASKGR